MRSVPVLFFILTFAFRIEAEDVSIKTIETVQQSVVPIVCMKPVGESAEVHKIMGTGFLINRDGYFLTAAHVVLELKPTCPSGTFWAIYAPATPWKVRTKERLTHWFRFTECRYNAQTDVAACKPLNNPFAAKDVNRNIRPIRFGTFANYPDGSPVAFTGFPLDSIVPVTSKGFIASYFPREDWIALDKSGWEGASGSPVYDVRGNTIGLLIRRTASQAGGLSFARPIDSILEFLRKEKIAIEK